MIRNTIAVIVLYALSATPIFAAPDSRTELAAVEAKARALYDDGRYPEARPHSSRRSISP